MPVIDFYIFKQKNKQQAHLFACSLLEKLYADGRFVCVHTNQLDDAERFEKLLWTYRDDSFIPHLLISDAVDQSIIPILIDYPQKTAIPRDILLNLSHTTPPNYQQSTQLIELVYDDPTEQQLARERFKYYREQGFEIRTF